jgi:hypothetical protein
MKFIFDAFRNSLCARFSLSLCKIYIQMIQRIQTIYLAVSMILLSIVATGSEVFRFVGNDFYFVFNSYGISQYANSSTSGKAEVVNAYPFYISLIAIVLLLFVTLMAYKNLSRQLKLVRIVFFLYLLLTIALVVFSFIGENQFEGGPFKRELGLGYLLFVLGLPFVFLANISIKRDKGLIDSLNRLR